MTEGPSGDEVDIHIMNCVHYYSFLGNFTEILKLTFGSMAREAHHSELEHSPK
jgi:hypothetical protein